MDKSVPFPCAKHQIYCWGQTTSMCMVPGIYAKPPAITYVFYIVQFMPKIPLSKCPTWFYKGVSGIFLAYTMFPFTYIAICFVLESHPPTLRICSGDHLGCCRWNPGGFSAGNRPHHCTIFLVVFEWQLN